MGSEDEGEEEEEVEGGGGAAGDKKKHRGNKPTTNSTPFKLDPKKKKILKEHPLHVTLKIQTKVKRKF
jgi:hypothetical protein